MESILKLILANAQDRQIRLIMYNNQLIVATVEVI